MVVAAVDVGAIVTVALTEARFLGDRSQDRVMNVPKELAEERDIVGRGDELRGAGMCRCLSCLGALMILFQNHLHEVLRCLGAVCVVFVN